MILSLLRNGISISNLLNFIVQIVMLLPAIIVSLSFHEAAHAYVAYRCGDPTAKNYGRLTLNPVKHIDPVGFAMLLLLGFGYAKPVPVNPNNYKNGRRDDILVSIAGIAANLILCLLFSAIYVAFIVIAVNKGFYNSLYNMSSLGLPTSGWGFVNYLIADFVSINLTLAIFNLLPIPPLDGSHIFNDLIFRGRAFTSRVSSGVGQIILIALLLTGVVSNIINFFMNRLYDLINWAIKLFL